MDDLDKKLHDEIHPAQPELSKEQLNELYLCVAANKKSVTKPKSYRLKVLSTVLICAAILAGSLCTLVFTLLDYRSGDEIAFLDAGQFELVDIAETELTNVLPDSLWPVAAMESYTYSQGRLYAYDSQAMAVELTYTFLSDILPIPSTITLYLKLKDNFVYPYDTDYTLNADTVTVNAVTVSAKKSRG